MLRTRHPTASRRRAVILMVVLALLTLFAIVGLTFVFYAQGQQTASLHWREATPPPTTDPQMLMNWSLAQLLFGPNHDETGAGSAMRGHSLADTKFGYNQAVLNSQPYSGTGRLHYPFTPLNTDDYELINYTYFQQDGFCRDPEYTGSRANPKADPAAAGQLYTGGANSPYTYPDLNTLFLGASLPNGTLLTPSFHRHWLFNPPPLAFNDPVNNPNWEGNTRGKYMTLRPRPVDHLMQSEVVAAGLPWPLPLDTLTPPQRVILRNLIATLQQQGRLFPYPEDGNGDVKNRSGAPGGNDSIWLDLNFPVQTSPDGRRFKPLFAYYIEDLDNRLNLNVHGNVMRPTAGLPQHTSNQGWGPWEVSLARLLNAGPGLDDNEHLIRGLDPNLRGRYQDQPNSADKVPGNGGGSVPAPPPGREPHFYAQIDLNADATARIGLTSIFPTFPYSVGPPTTGYANGAATSTEGLNHALLYDFQTPVGDFVFPVADLKPMLYENFIPNRPQLAHVVRLCPNTLGSSTNGAVLRSLHTTRSMDVGRPSVAPWIWDWTTDSLYVAAPPAPATIPNPDVAPSGPKVAFRPLPLGTPPAATDFSPDRRSRIARLGLERLNLNRPLLLYPPQVSDNNELTDPMLLAQLRQRVGAVVQDRQKRATEIFHRLLFATGTPPPADWTTPTPMELGALRWLAQLAANLVDYIDEDEVATYFNFYLAAISFPGYSGALSPTDDVMRANLANDDANNPLPAGQEVPKYWVYGTELPKVVLHEAHAEIEPPADPGVGQTAQGMVDVKVWAELHCPFPPPPPTNPGTSPQDDPPVPLFRAVMNMPGGGYSPYRVVIANTRSQTEALANTHANVLGRPDTVRNGNGNGAAFNGNPVLTVAEWEMAMPPPMPTGRATLSPGGFFLVGPDGNNPTGNTKGSAIATTANPATPGGVLWFRTPEMQYQTTANVSNNAGTYQIDSLNPDDRYDPPNNRFGLTVLLRRLANPNLPEDNNRVLPSGQVNPLYNPYITVDYVDQLPLNDVGPQGGPIPAALTMNSRGKRQPYAAFRSHVPGQATAGATANPRNTFGQANQAPPPALPASALVHLDRQIISPVELLHVSGFRPHQLTQKFVGDNGGTPVPHAHRIPWFDEDLATANPPRSHRLYRLFELVTAGERAAGVGAHGRIPGKININTVWDQRIINALCDRQDSNSFFEGGGMPPLPNDVQDVGTRLFGRRTPGLFTTGLSRNDRPFLGMAAPDLPDQDPAQPAQPLDLPLTGPGTHPRGIVDTLFSPNLNPTFPNQRLFETGAAADHPYQRLELLTKIYDRLTVRSNAFAVWMTVGFFEVHTDQATGRDVLGTEIGKAQGLEVRHRFFFVLDRTRLAQDPPAQGIQGLTTLGAVNTPSPIQAQWVAIGALQSTDPGAQQVQQQGLVTNPSVPGTMMAGPVQVGWRIGPGSVLYIDRRDVRAVALSPSDPPYPSDWRSNEEMVLVVETSRPGEFDPNDPPPPGTNAIKAIFVRPHGGGATVAIPSHPGPVNDPMQFDPLKEPSILYMEMTQ